MTSPSPTSSLRSTVLASFLLMTTAVGVEAQARETSVRRTAALMGTVARIDVEAADRRRAQFASEAALRAMIRVERQLSSWLEDSDISRLNRAPTGTPASPGLEVATLLSEALRWSDRTGGAFHPVVGALIDAWDLRGAGRHPSVAELKVTLQATGDRGIVVDRVSGTLTRMTEASWIDTGGFGKGAALRAAADTLRALGVLRGTLDLGGQLVAIGDGVISVSVAHPTNRSSSAATLFLENASVATSGQSERSIEVEGKALGHILDPRTGRPVPAWGSVTVVASDPMVADILSTALFVMGPIDGMSLADSLQDVGVLFLRHTAGELTKSMNSRMADLLLRSSRAAPNH